MRVCDVYWRSRQNQTELLGQCRGVKSRTYGWWLGQFSWMSSSGNAAAELLRKAVQWSRPVHPCTA